MDTTDGTMPTRFTELWDAIDMGRWRETPCLIGAVACENDVRVGRAVFFLESPTEIGAEFADIGLPHCAVWTDDHQQRIPVIIIQSERAGDKHYIGYRFLDGGNGVGLGFEFQLLDSPNELFPNSDA